MFCRCLPTLRAILQATRQHSNVGDQPKIFKHWGENAECFAIPLGIVSNQRSRDDVTYRLVSAIADCPSHLARQWFLQRRRRRKERPVLFAATTWRTAGSIASRTLIAVEFAPAYGTFINHPLFTIWSVTKRFVFAVLSRTLACKHLGASTLRLVLGNVITTIVPARTTIITTRPTIITTRPALATTLTRLPLTTRRTITPTLTTRPTIITTRTTLTGLPLTTRRTITPTLTTRPTIITTRTTIATTLTRLPLTTRTASPLTAGRPFAPSVVFAVYWLFIG